MQLGKPKTRPVLLEDAAAEAYRTRIFAQTKSAFGVAYLLNWLGRDCGVSLSAVAPALSRQMKADLVSLFGLYRPLRNEALPEFWGAQADALDKLLASQNLSATDEVSISFKHRNFVGRIGKIDVDWENSGGDIASVEVILMQADEKQIAIPCRVQDGVIDGIRKTGNYPGIWPQTSNSSLTPGPAEKSRSSSVAKSPAEARPLNRCATMRPHYSFSLGRLMTTKTMDRLPIHPVG